MNVKSFFVGMGAVAVSLLGLGGCAADSSPPDDVEQNEDALVGRSTAEICGAVETRWGDGWETADATGEKRVSVTNAVSCANRSYWLTRYRPAAVHAKFYLHRGICLANPASHFAMREEQAQFYCAFSLHLRMCNTQGLYALKAIPDSATRRARENAIFAECLALSGELDELREGLRLRGKTDAEVSTIVRRLYDEYKVVPGVRVAPAIVNPDRARHALLERVLRTSFYGVTVPIEVLEGAFSDLFLLQEGAEHESQLELISYYRSHLTSAGGKNLLDTTDLPICGNGRVEPGEQCDGDGACSALCTTR
jgi:hypothetical protein